MTLYTTWLAVALDATEEACAYLRRAWRTDHRVRPKGFRDIVTEADLAVEAILLKSLRTHFPDHAVTSEEAGADAEGAAVRWLVDPVDGTTNFSRNNPNFSISIAALEHDVPVVGVVADPLRSHIFSACAGGGASLNDEPLQVSRVTDLTSAVIGFDTPKETVLRQQLWRYIESLLHEGRTLRALGSAALNMAYVAAGWVDVYFSVHMKPWDQAAAGLLVQEAGGVMTTIHGESWTPYQTDPLAVATPLLLDALSEVLEASS